MECYLLNTDAKSMPDGRSPHEKWFHHGMAFCAEYTSKESKQNFDANFRKLKPGDVCLMYANGIGIVGAGKVCEEYNGRTYPEAECLVYVGGSDGYGKEHRIRVEWTDLRNSPNRPVSYEQFLSITDIIPLRAFIHISQGKAEELLKLIHVQKSLT